MFGKIYQFRWQKYKGLVNFWYNLFVIKTEIYIKFATGCKTTQSVEN